jgi:exo-beta-1,3-glucanase (GH17 family)
MHPMKTDLRACTMPNALSLRRAVLALLATGWLLCFSACGGSSPPAAAQTAAGYRVHGLDFGPYIRGQDPNINPRVGTDQLRGRLALIANRTDWIRTFGSADGLEAMPALAREFGLKLAMGAWLSTNLAANETQITNLIAAGRSGDAAVLIVGSEVLLRGDLTQDALLGYIQRVKAAVPAVPVAYADTYSMLLAHPQVLRAIDQVWANYHPYWEGIAIDDAVAAVHSRHQQVLAAAGGKPVVVSESGWPSAGNTVGRAVPSAANAARFMLEFVSWARATQVVYFLFEALDEAWKARYEGPQGAHWGLFDEAGTLKPGMQDVFDGKTSADTWSSRPIPGGPGTPTLGFTFVPAYGTFSDLQGQALHVAPTDYNVTACIQVAGRWWTKPTAASPLTPIGPDGRWTVDITTGGIDEKATAIAAFLLPAGYQPPALLGDAALPAELLQRAVARADAARKP